MKHTLFCIIVLAALQDGNTALVNAGTRRAAAEGGNITVGCTFYISGVRKLFCKEKCEDEGILVETSADAAQRGRYSIKYEKNSGIASYHILYVSITQLKKSDSGWYRCSLDRPLSPDPNDDFEIVVTEASTTSTPNVTLRPFSASGFLSSASTPPTLSVSSGSGSSTPPSASPGSSDVLLCVGLILGLVISVVLAALLIFYKGRRATKSRGPPVETECAGREDNRLYEEIRERGSPSRSPFIEVSSVYTTVKGPQPEGGEITSLYSLVTSAKNQVEDDSDDLSYSEVDFSHIPAACSAPCGNATHAV